MERLELDQVEFDTPAHLAALGEFLSLPRETVPQLTLEGARKALGWAASALDLDLVEGESGTPVFVLLPPVTPPDVTLFAAWHAEASPVAPAAVEGAERLALAACLGALDALRRAPRAVAAAPPITAALVVAPGGSQGSRPLAETLARHRARLAGPAAFWVRVAPAGGGRRRVFLGARGRVVIGIWGSEANPYRIRDELIRPLSDEAYGPRPLDFELLRKLASRPEALEFLEETLDDPGAVAGEGELRLRNALFEPKGSVLAPQVRHPDRPQAWITIETAENMEAADILGRVRALAGGSRVEMAEEFHWDRFGIHHPAVRAEIKLAQSRPEGVEIWPMSPWTTPSGVFTRALGTPLPEWGVPLPEGTRVRAPSPEALGAMEREVAELLLRAGAGGA